MAAPWQLLVVSALVVLLVVSLLRSVKRRGNCGSSPAVLKFPGGPPSWPILGHLPLVLFSGSCRCRPLHQTLAQLSAGGYGPIMGLRLGWGAAPSTVIVSSAAMAKEFLVTHDKAFANRPRYQFMDNLFYGYDTAVAFSSYCHTWLKLRKIYTLELLTAKRLQEFQHVRLDSVRALLHRLHQASASGTRAVELRESIEEMASHTMTRLLFSAGGHGGLLKLIRDMDHAVATPLVGDFIPCLKCLDFLRLRSMKNVHARFDNIIDAIVSERRQAMKRTTQSPHDLPQDFLQVLLSKEATSNYEIAEEELITTQQIKASLLDMLGGGIHSTSITLEWTMAELLKHPSCLRKLQVEVDTVMGKKGEKLVRDEHLTELPYLENTVKEVFRLHPPGPLLLPRISSSEVKVDKYTLPAGTQVMVNVWAIGRDPQVWENAEQFLPERFEGKDIDFKGKHFDLLPFGSGRRICPGIRLASSVLLVTLANLVKAFDWELPQAGQSGVDMSERGGITNPKATPLLAIPKLRHNNLHFDYN